MWSTLYRWLACSPAGILPQAIRYWTRGDCFLRTLSAGDEGRFNPQTQGLDVAILGESFPLRPSFVDGWPGPKSCLQS
jgi:hypothetical protein